MHIAIKSQAWRVSLKLASYVYSPFSKIVILYEKPWRKALKQYCEWVVKSMLTIEYCHKMHFFLMQLNCIYFLRECRRSNSLLWNGIQNRSSIIRSHCFSYSWHGFNGCQPSRMKNLDSYLCHMLSKIYSMVFQSYQTATDKVFRNIRVRVCNDFQKHPLLIHGDLSTN